MVFLYSSNPQASLEKIDALIDAHTLATFPELNEANLFSQQYAIEIIVSQQFVGGVAFTKQYDSIHVNALAVDSHYRQQQYGTLLMQELEKYCEDLDVHTISLSTLSYQALGFYQKLAYQLAGQIPDYPTQGMTKYFLFKKL
ncbi:GNAT family N-acetyltransferase [Fundicoccus culcitae]|uniref:GNAT family N-acetyltransferase n=1 Tax=Fundicoccus culcitae TaxID=2969821 RepID=A0ABY5P7H7_9LACT|nr:GNAT family N-acetyltransferase [Fundicoccus culcitae]UUX34624.1 GNAT family N-acetyltransferase [Fundicoccus culcitae]